VAVGEVLAEEAASVAEAELVQRMGAEDLAEVEGVEGGLAPAEVVVAERGLAEAVAVEGGLARAEVVVAEQGLAEVAQVVEVEEQGVVEAQRSPGSGRAYPACCAGQLVAGAAEELGLE
jgi:hypothetical protein